jgi:hypothetical protein
VLDIEVAKGRIAYKDYFSRQREMVRETLQQNAIPLLQLSTTDEPVIALQQWFGKGRRQAVAGGAAR